MAMARCGSLNRSVQELNNRNNLASIQLEKELTDHDRRKKYLMEHIDKCRVDAYRFLKQLRICNSNLVPAYKELLDGIATRPVLTRRLRLRDTEKGKSSSTQLHGHRLQQHKNPFKPNVTTSRVHLLHIRTTHLSNQERVELFLKYLKERNSKTENQKTEINPTVEVMSRKVSKHTSVNLPASGTDSCRESWTQGRNDSFYSIEQLGNVHSEQSNHSFKIWDNGTRSNAAPRITQILPDAIHYNKDFVKRGSPLEKTRVLTRCTLDARLRTFYTTLDRLKMEQDARLVGVSWWERRRRWLQLTKEGQGQRGEGEWQGQGQGQGQREGRLSDSLNAGDLEKAHSLEH